jgi:probable HAF family extracellular repeat protein
MFKTYLRLSGLVIIYLLVSAQSAAAQKYDIIDIGTLRSDESSIATGINNSGDVVGISTDKKGQTSAFYWRDGKIKQVHGLKKKHSFATGVNDSGQVIGYELEGKGTKRAFIYSIDKDDPVELPTLDGGMQTLASGINNSGQVVGRCAGEHHDHQGDHEDGERAFKYSEGSIIDLQKSFGLERLGGKRSDAICINNHGRIAGHFYTSVHIGYSRGFFHEEGADPIDIGSLGGNNTVVSGINDSDQVVGYSHILNGDLRAYVWDRIHGFLTINPFPGGTQSLAYDINNRGQIVGASDSIVKRLRAFIYTDGRLQDLNSLITSGSGWELVTARAINDRGQIVGEGVIGGERRAYLLNPRP